MKILTVASMEDFCLSLMRTGRYTGNHSGTTVPIGAEEEGDTVSYSLSVVPRIATLCSVTFVPH